LSNKIERVQGFQDSREMKRGLKGPSEKRKGSRVLGFKGDSGDFT
jgi:hypothetical protein